MKNLAFAGSAPATHLKNNMALGDLLQNLFIKTLASAGSAPATLHKKFDLRALLRPLLSRLHKTVQVAQAHTVQVS